MYHLHTFSCTYFYSHPREGGDIEDSNFVERQYISIHAPAKGATSDSSCLVICSRYFYSRPREGGDEITDVSGCASMQFLFTPPRRGRQEILWDESNGTLFLFTPPRRGRHNGKGR